MTYEQVLANSKPQVRAAFEKLVVSKAITGKQIARILEYGFALTIKEKYPLLLGAIRLIGTLRYLQSLSPKIAPDKSRQEAIARLLSKNSSIEASNELLTHTYLSRNFPGYQVLPLFGDMPDGIIKIDEQRVQVEIKSRFSTKYKVLKDFCNRLAETLPVHKGLIVICEVLILEVEGLTQQICDEELGSLTSLNNKIDFASISKEKDFVGQILRDNKGFKYQLQLAITHNPEPAFMPGTFPDKCFYSTAGGTIAESVEGYLALSQAAFTKVFAITVFIADEIEQYLAKVIVEECINSAKNFPKTGYRMLVINIPDDIALDKNASDAYLERYIAGHSETAILVVSTTPCDTAGAVGTVLFSVKYFCAGNQIKNLINQAWVIPETQHKENGLAIKNAYFS